VLAAMRYEVAAELVARLAPEEAATLLDELRADDVVDILGRIPPEQLDRILSRLDAEDADEIQGLLSYDENSAGGLMSRAFVACPEDATVAQALDAVRGARDLPRNAFFVYVVDREQRLVGACSLRDIVRARPEQALREVMTAEVITVTPATDQEEVADIVSRYDLLAVPVVDDHRHLLGIVEVDDVVDVLREEATEDMLKMAGAGERLVEARSFGASFRSRSRWLAAAAAGGVLAAISLSAFEGALQAVPLLALFMPVVAGMGGNVGTQSSTVVVRGLAVGFVETERIRRVVVREVGLGATSGVLYGLLIAGVAMALGDGAVDPLRLGAVVALGTFLSMTLAAAVGTLVPLLLDRLAVDPAIATGPFVTTSVDVLGLMLYLWLAARLLGIGL
jgi:magnesium transporter